MHVGAHVGTHTAHTCGVALTEIGGCLLCPGVCLGSQHRQRPGDNPLRGCSGATLQIAAQDAVLGSFLAVGSHTISLSILLKS